MTPKMYNNVITTLANHHTVFTILVFSQQITFVSFHLINFSGHEDQTYIQWMWLHQGHPKRCECGYWFKLVEKAPV